MRTPSRATSGGRVGSTGKTGRALLSGVLAICLAGSMAIQTVPAEAAKPKPPVIPSKAAVERAKQAAASKAGQVAAIERQLAAANARLEQLGIQSGIADEAYNGAVYKLQQAKAEAAAAAARAAKAQQTLAIQRQQIGRFAAASYQGGGDVAKIAPLFTADGPQQLLDSAGAARSVSTAMQGSYLRYTATQVVTNLFKVQADQAVVKVKQATDEAAKAKQAAEDAEAAQAAAVTAMGVQRTQSIAQLAVLQNTSVRVAAQRQRGLEELARQRAAALAARKAAELKRRIAAREAAERAREKAEQARREGRAGAGGEGGPRAGEAEPRQEAAEAAQAGPAQPATTATTTAAATARAGERRRRSTSRCPSSATCICGAGPVRPAGTAPV